MADKSLAIRLSLKDADTVRNALKALGTDGATALAAVERAANPASRALDGVRQRAAGITPAMRQAQRDIETVNAALAAGTISAAEYGRVVGQLEAKLSGTTRAAQQSAGGISMLTSALGPLAGIASTAFAIDKVVDFGRAVVAAGDTVTRLGGRFSALTGSAGAGAAAVQQVFDITSKTGAAVEDTGQAFTQFFVAASSVGATQKETARLVETIQKLGVVGGASMQSMIAGSRQLAQGLAADRFAGDEFKSVMENMPLVARALADALGVTIGKLREMSEAGELTAERVFGALGRKAAEADRLFAEIPVTVDRAAGQAASAWTEFAAAIDNSLGLSRSLAATLQGVAGLLRGLTPASQQATLAGLRQSKAALEAQLDTDGIKALRDELAEMRRTPEAYTAEIAAREKLLATRQKEIDAIQLKIRAIDGEVSAEQEATSARELAERATVAATKAEVAAAKATKERTEAQKELDKVLSGLDPKYKAGKDRKEAVEALDKALKAGNITLQEHAQYVLLAGKAYDEALKKADGLNKKVKEKKISFDSLHVSIKEATEVALEHERRMASGSKEYQAVIKAEEELADKLTREAVPAWEQTRQKLAEYQGLLEREKIGPEVYAYHVDKLTRSLEEQDPAFKAAQRAAEEYQREVERVVGRTTDRIVDFGADALFDVLSGKSKDFWEEFKDLGLRAIAQIAADMVLRPLLEPLIRSAVTGAPGLFGITAPAGGGQAGGGINIPGLGSLDLGGVGSWLRTPIWSSGSSSAGAAYYGSEGLFGPGASTPWGAGGAGGAAGMQGGWSVAPMDILGPIASALPGILSGNYVQAGLGAGGFVAGNLIAPGIGGPIGALAGNLLGGLFGGKEPSNEGAEISFRLDESFTDFFTSDKHPDRVRQVDAYTEGLQTGLMRASARYGVGLDADAVVGSTFGRKEGSRFFYDPGQGIDARVWADFESGNDEETRAAAEQVIVAAIKGGFVDAGEGEEATQAGLDLATAMLNSAATSFEQLDKDVAFAKAMPDFEALARGAFDPVAASYRSAVEEGRAYAAGIVEQGRAFRQTAEDLGFGAADAEGGLSRADTATRGYVLSLFSSEEGLSAATREVVKQRAAIAELETQLLQFNITAEEAAEITSGLTQALKDGFVGDLQAEINELDGRGYINVFDGLIAKFAETSDQAWLLSDTNAELVANMALVDAASQKRIQNFVDAIAAEEDGAAKLLLVRQHAIDAGWGTDVFDNALVGLGVSLTDVANGVVGVTGTMQSAVATLMSTQQAAIGLAQAQATLNGTRYIPGSATELVHGAIGGSNANFNQLGQGISPVFFQTIDGLLSKARTGGLTQADLSAFASTNLANQSGYAGRWNAGELGAIAQALRGAFDAQSTNLPESVGGVSASGGGGAAADDGERKAIQATLDARRKEERAISAAASDQERLRDRYADIADRLSRFRSSLLQSSVSPLSPKQRLDLAEEEWLATLARAQAGDQEAMEDIEEVGRTFADRSREYWASAGEHDANIQRILSGSQSVEVKARDLQAEAVSQLTTLNRTLDEVLREIAQLDLRLDSAGSPSLPGSPGLPGSPISPGSPSLPGNPGLPGGDYAFGYGSLGRQQGEAAQAFLLRMFPGQAAGLMADGVITDREGYDWAQQWHASGIGITNAAYFGAARAAGYSQPGQVFGSGAHQGWLNADASEGRWRVFIDRLRDAGGDFDAGFWASFGGPSNYAQGGLVVGPGIPGLDAVRAMVAPGEYVLPADRVREIGLGRLDDLRRGGPANDDSAREIRALRADLRVGLSDLRDELRADKVQRAAATRTQVQATGEVAAAVRQNKPREIDPGYRRRA